MNRVKFQLLLNHKSKETRGDFTINGALILALIFALLVLAISTIGVANRAMRLHSMAAELTRYIEVRGQVDGAVGTEVARLETVTGIDVDYLVDAIYIPGTTKVQFGNSINVTLTCRAEFGIGGVISVPMTLKSTVAGRSEMFWK